MTETESNLPARSISELVAVPDFPTSVVGERVDIKGYTGVITAVVNNSIKVRSDEGNLVSYNFHTLLRLYSPRIEPEEAPAAPAPPVIEPAALPQPKRNVILEPNFQSPVVPIETLIHRPDFPACAFGVFVDLHGFSGVVVELVGRSLKIRPREGSLRSYNAEGLRKIYPKP